jgi:hypothetical protein
LAFLTKLLQVLLVLGKDIELALRAKGYSIAQPSTILYRSMLLLARSPSTEQRKKLRNGLKEEDILFLESM